MVSVELHTDLANDLEGAVSYGKRFHAICPERFYVKVPLTPSGCLAARRLGEAGIDVNFTLGFSARQNYVIALTAKPAFVNVFMGRLNAFAAENRLNDGSNVGERATAASQRVIDSLRKGPGGIKTRQIGASMRTGTQVATLAGLDVFTMPTKVAKEFVALAMDPAEVRSRIDSKYDVVWNAGIDEKSLGLGVLWEVGEDVGKAMCKLAGEDVSAMTPESLVAFLAANGMGSVFPGLSAAERARIVKEGKAPLLASWRDEVRTGRLAWDSLFTEAGLGSFAQDQKALDDRIRKVLKG
jgi:transaldolase